MRRATTLLLAGLLGLAGFTPTAAAAHEDATEPMCGSGGYHPYLTPHVEVLCWYLHLVDVALCAAPVPMPRDLCPYQD